MIESETEMFNSLRANITVGTGKKKIVKLLSRNGLTVMQSIKIVTKLLVPKIKEFDQLKKVIKSSQKRQKID